MPWVTEAVSIQTNTPSTNAIGEAVASWAITATATARRHYKSSKRFEWGEMGGAERLATMLYFEFRPEDNAGALPTITTAKRLLDAAGVTWQVTGVRNYTWSLQVDVETVS